MLVTPLYAGLLTLWFLVLSAAVIRRRRAGISLGDGGDARMQRVIRGHANFAEYVPLALVMLGILEATRHSIYVLHLLGLLLLAGRVLHGYALTFTRSWPLGRTLGIALTFAVLLAEALMCIAQALRGHELWMRGLL
jgi:uncharacterized membrane protein YecN with MAPEG domain